MKDERNYFIPYPSSLILSKRGQGGFETYARLIPTFYPKEPSSVGVGVISE
jgi:hypothetical protein